MSGDQTVVIAVVLVVGIFLVILITQVLFPSSEKQKREELRKKQKPVMYSAQKLFNDGHYEQSLMQSFKAVEIVVRGMAGRDNSTFEAIKQLHKRGKLSEAAVAKAHFLRKTRNNVAHESQNVTKQLAQQSLSDAKRVITTLLK